MHRYISRATYPEAVRAAPKASLFGLAPSGVYLATTVASCAVRSYRTISPLPISSLEEFAGGIFSAALSVDSHPPGVTWHLTLWSPDFPL